MRNFGTPPFSEHSGNEHPISTAAGRIDRRRAIHLALEPTRDDEIVARELRVLTGCERVGFLNTASGSFEPRSWGVPNRDVLEPSHRSLSVGRDASSAERPAIEMPDCEWVATAPISRVIECPGRRILLDHERVSGDSPVSVLGGLVNMC
ncbi:hypothetical protein [Ilumatobacter sp.]|uniref:hypothetical protein n=1 Tax=Ilumatobacter sp. TaxID=1967498 RepID=UPI003B52EA4E